MRHALVASLRLLSITALIGCPFACGSDGKQPLGPIGTPCIPAEEQKKNFAGYETTEVSVEAGGETCSPGICLVAHFQGRVSCPYGQPSNGMVDPNTGLLETDPNIPLDDHCFLAGTRPSDSTMVVVPVEPQLVARPPDKAVYCSCRCDGPNPKGSYCACPQEYVCEQLVFSGGEPFEGSYCIKRGTEVSDPQTLQTGQLCTTAKLQPRPVGCGVNKHPGGI